MNKKVKFNIIIPMAGESSRFGFEFKPFIKLDSRTFIEHVLDSFRNIEVETYNFIITKEQEKANNVAASLKNIVPHIAHKINVIKISTPTDGPYQTVMAALELLHPRALKNLLICDCDHYVDVDPIAKLMSTSPSAEIIIPLWEINYSEHQNWGKLILDSNTDSIIEICEKEIIPPRPDRTVHGILGCHYVSSSDLLAKDDKYIHFSDFLRENHLNYNTALAFVENAYFFGSPEMARAAIGLRRRWETVICDVDGVLIHHRNHSTDAEEDNILIKECAATLRRWQSQNKKIIFATARHPNTREDFKNNLHNLGLVYDEIVMGLNPGPRYLINDLKPSSPFVNQATAFNVVRDTGIDDLDLDESENYDIEVVDLFKGNSFSKTYLLKNKETLFVRKHIMKSKLSLPHYEKLRRQAADMRRFSFYDPSLVPQVIKERDNVHEYYYDMEYLENYKQLDEYESAVQTAVLKKVVSQLASTVYAYKKSIHGPSFILQLLDDKIYPKLQIFEDDDAIMFSLINNEKISINGKEYYGLRTILNKFNLHEFGTEAINPIHGDLTLENILYNEKTQDFKLIDMDGSRYMDTCYFDLGKIFQSIVAKYKEWNSLGDVVYNQTESHIQCLEKYFMCNALDYQEICEQFGLIMNNPDWKKVYRKGIFYMAMYFIRFIPFRKKVSNDHGIYAMIMAVNWLNYLYEH